MHGPTLITGISGFTGRHLAARLCAAEEVVGLGLAATTEVDVARYVACDLADAARVREVIDEVAPARVYHLACCPPTAPVERLQSVIVDGFRNLAAALQRSAVATGRRVRMLTVGSAAELGFCGTQKLPAGEHAPCEPTSDYGRAKLAVTRIVCEARPTEGLEIVVARTFNLVGPGLGESLALGRFAQQIAAYRRGEIDRIRCGRLDHRRDYVDVRDAVAGYQLLLEHGRPGEVYNVCSGRSRQMDELLKLMLQAAEVDAPIEIADDRPQAGDVVDVYGDPRKTVVECGWSARTPIQRSLSEMLSAVPVMSA